MIMYQCLQNYSYLSLWTSNILYFDNKLLVLEILSLAKLIEVETFRSDS